MAKVLNRWLREGKTVKKYEIERYVKELRKYKRFDHALQVVIPSVDLALTIIIMSVPLTVDQMRKKTAPFSRY